MAIKFLALVAIEIEATSKESAQAQASEFGLVLDIERDHLENIGQIEAEAVMGRMSL